MILAVCEFYNKKIHGGNGIDMNNKILLSYKIPLNEFYNNEYKSYLKSMNNFYNKRVTSSEKNHSIIKNYRNIIHNDKYYQLNIVRDIELPSGELTAILKTTYLKQLQRKIKNYLRK
jgi:archaellin